MHKKMLNMIHKFPFENSKFYPASKLVKFHHAYITYIHVLYVVHSYILTIRHHFFSFSTLDVFHLSKMQSNLINVYSSSFLDDISR